jgi:2-amino-4-hydroxy-6-hydroxymethyldihydropteridine diphosphokinase
MGDRIISLPGLEVPHPHVSERRFALLPVCELLPELIHPVSGKSVKKTAGGM